MRKFGGGVGWGERWGLVGAFFSYEVLVFRLGVVTGRFFWF